MTEYHQLSITSTYGTSMISFKSCLFHKKDESGEETDGLTWQQEPSIIFTVFMN